MNCCRTRCGTLVACVLAASLATDSAKAQRATLRERENRPASTRKASEAKPSKSAADGKLEVKSFSPRGPVPVGAVISITFDGDVISSETLDAGSGPGNVFSFEPNIEGAVQWENRRQVRFVPTRALRQGTEYVVRINPRLRSEAGLALADAPEYRFQTPALTFKRADQYMFTADRRVTVQLSFSDKVNPAELAKFLTLKSGDTPVAWRPTSQVATAMPTITTDPMTTDALTVILEPGLTGISGPLGLRSRVEQKVKLDFRLTATRVTGTWTKGVPSLDVKFSSYPSLAEADKFIQIDPPVKVSFDSAGGNTLRIKGPFEAEKRYTVHIKKGFTGYNNKVLLEDVTLSAWMPSMTPFVELDKAGGYLGTQGRMKVRVKSAAMNNLIVKAHRVFDNNLPHHMEHDDWYGVNRYGRKVAEKTIALNSQPNSAVVTELDLRELLGAKATGVYGLEVTGETSSTITGSDDDDYYYYDRRYQQRTVINLSNLGLVAKKSPQEVTVFVAGLDSAQPLPGIHVQVYSNKFQLMGEGDTNAAGMVTISQLKEDEPDAEPEMLVAHNADKSELSLLSLNDSLDGLSQFYTSGRDFLRQGYEAYVTPERGAYRPGETAHVTGLVRGRDAAPPGSGFPVEVQLVRPDGKRMTPQVVTPGDSGLFSTDIEIPTYAPTGYYDVEIRMPGTPVEEEDDEY